MLEVTNLDDLICEVQTDVLDRLILTKEGLVTGLQNVLKMLGCSGFVRSIDLDTVKQSQLRGVSNRVVVLHELYHRDDVSDRIATPLTLRNGF